MPMLRNKTKIMTRTVIFLAPYNSHAVDYSRDRRQCIPKMTHFQTAITRQFDWDNSFFKLLIEKTTLPDYDGVSFI